MKIYESLQEALLLVTLITTVIGGVYVVYNVLAQPNFSDGTYFEAARIEYGTAENTLFFEYTYGGAGSSIPAFAEALHRTSNVMWINWRLKDNPLRVVALTRLPGSLEPITMVTFVLYPDDTAILRAKNTKNTRYELFQRVWLRCSVHEESFIVATLTPAHNIKQSREVFKQNSKSFKAITRQLNSSKMCAILDPM